MTRSTTARIIWEGIKRAKVEGRFKGWSKAIDYMKLRAQGVSPTELASPLGIGRTSIYRALLSDTPKGEGC